MRIAHAVHGYPPELIGGTEFYVARLARAQREAGHDVRIFAGSVDWRPEFQTEDQVADGIPVRRVHRNDLYFDGWDKGYNPLVSAAWRRFLGEVRPEVVHIHHWIRLTSDLVTIAARQGVPAVVAIHDLLPTCPRVFRLKDDAGDVSCEEPMGVTPCVPCVPRWRFQGDDEVAGAVSDLRDDMRRELALARVVTAPTPEHGAFCGAMLGAAVPVRVTPLGSVSPPPTAFPPASDDGRVHVATWGNLHPLKGVHVLLDAVRRTRDPSRFVLRLLGGFATEEYEARLRGLADGQDVTFHGAYERHELADAPMDLAVLPTLCRESWSFVLDEAALLGVPILASDTGALRDRATPRVMHFTRNDPAALAERLDAFADDPALGAAMRAAPPPEVVPFDRHAPLVLKIYEQAVAAGPPDVPPGGDEDRLRLLWERREAHFRELVKSAGWPDVVAELRRRVAELEAGG